PVRETSLESVIQELRAVLARKWMGSHGNPCEMIVGFQADESAACSATDIDLVAGLACSQRSERDRSARFSHRRDRMLPVPAHLSRQAVERAGGQLDMAAFEAGLGPPAQAHRAIGAERAADHIPVLRPAAVPPGPAAGSVATNKRGVG